MDHFQFKDARLHCEEVALSTIADEIGTPCFVYSCATLERHWHAFNNAFGDYPHHICYAVKANGNLAILSLLAKLGSGFDIVSGGELKRVIAAGGDPAKTVFSGVCKQDWEIRDALNAGIDCFNIESKGELEQISAIAGSMKKIASIAVRINPEVDAKTHPYISTGLRSNKFGLEPAAAMQTYEKAQADPNIHIQGVACHIGSQLTDLAPYRDALQKMLDFIDSLEAKGIEIEQIDFGGGLGVRYSDEEPPSPDQYWTVLSDLLSSRNKIIPVAIEPGRAIVANAGALLTTVYSLKHNEDASFCIVDAGMNDLIRPALYQAYQEIVEVEPTGDAEEIVCDVVGPVCESGDFLGKQRTLKVAAGDRLAVRTSGAYASAMSSNYNGRARAAEIMVDGDQFHIVRQRETLESLYDGESVLP